MSGSIRLSVVIVWRHERERIEACLSTLRDQLEAMGGEVIVVAGVSADSIEKARLAGPGAVWIRLEGADRQARCWAAGLAHSRGTIVAFGSANNLYAGDWCESALAAPPAMDEIVAGPVLPAAGLSRHALAVFLCDYGPFINPDGEPIGQAAANNMAFLADDLRDPSADLGLDKTALLTGGRFRVRWVPEVAVSLNSEAPVAAELLGRFHRGRHYAAMRSAPWPRFVAILAGLACAVLPLILFGRMLANRLLRHDFTHVLLLEFPRIVLALQAWSLGELAGYWFGESLPSEVPMREAEAPAETAGLARPAARRAFSTPSSEIVKVNKSIMIAESISL
ncbi:MAG TPA: hypothetical protein VGZ22_05585 [Isosphaeraceae bacterium]|jgi:hypothetical protein|nr:hypothetical protein [Isosphaeraceae bacterium]